MYTTVQRHQQVMGRYFLLTLLSLFFFPPNSCPCSPGFFLSADLLSGPPETDTDRELVLIWLAAERRNWQWVTDAGDWQVETMSGISSWLCEGWLTANAPRWCDAAENVGVSLYCVLWKHSTTCTSTDAELLLWWKPLSHFIWNRVWIIRRTFFTTCSIFEYFFPLLLSLWINYTCCNIHQNTAQTMDIFFILAAAFLHQMKPVIITE